MLGLVAILTNMNTIGNFFMNIGGSGSNIAVIVDHNGYISDQELEGFFPQYEWMRVNSLDFSHIEEYIGDDTYAMVIRFDGEVAYLYQRGDSFFQAYSNILSMMTTQNRQARVMQQHGLSPQEILEIQTPVPVNVVNVIRDASEYHLYVYLLIVMLYTSIISYGSMIASSVISEKSSKTMEVLITSAQVKSLMFGKVFGVGLAGLSQTIFLGCSALVILWLNARNWFIGMPYGADIPQQFTLSLSLIAYAVIFFVIGYFVYAFVFAGLASLLSRIEDTGTVTTIPTFISMAGMLIAIIGMSDPNSLYVRITSFIPFFSPMVMFMRIGLTEVHPIEIIASIAISLITIGLLGMLAAKIYRLGVMMYGNPPKLRTIISLLIKA